MSLRPFDTYPTQDVISWRSFDAWITYRANRARIAGRSSIAIVARSTVDTGMTVRTRRPGSPTFTLRTS